MYIYGLRPLHFFILFFIDAVLICVGIFTELTLLKLFLIFLVLLVIYIFMFQFESEEKLGEENIMEGD